MSELKGHGLDENAIGVLLDTVTTLKAKNGTDMGDNAQALIKLVKLTTEHGDPGQKEASATLDKLSTFLKENPSVITSLKSGDLQSAEGKKAADQLIKFGESILVQKLSADLDERSLAMSEEPHASSQTDAQRSDQAVQSANGGPLETTANSIGKAAATVGGAINSATDVLFGGATAKETLHEMSNLASRVKADLTDLSHIADESSVKLEEFSRSVPDFDLTSVLTSPGADSPDADEQHGGDGGYGGDGVLDSAVQTVKEGVGAGFKIAFSLMIVLIIMYIIMHAGTILIYGLGFGIDNYSWFKSGSGESSDRGGCAPGCTCPFCRAKKYMSEWNSLITTNEVTPDGRPRYLY